MSDFLPTSSKYARSVCVYVEIEEHYAIILMGNLICIYSENVNGVLRDDCKWSTLLYVMWGEFLMVMSLCLCVFN